MDGISNSSIWKITAVEAIQTFVDLTNRFDALEYETSSQEDFITATKQLEWMRATVENIFGVHSPYVAELTSSPPAKIGVYSVTEIFHKQGKRAGVGKGHWAIRPPEDRR